MTHKINLSHDVIFKEGYKWNFMKGQSSEGMPFLELRVLGIKLGLESSRERIQESGALNASSVAFNAS